MTCPVCGAETKVMCCRKDCESVVRRRKCVECGYVFYTQELEVDGATYSEMEKDYKNLRKIKEGKCNDRKGLERY